jgi:hypothetical protein
MIVLTCPQTALTSKEIKTHLLALNVYLVIVFTITYVCRIATQAITEQVLVLALVASVTEIFVINATMLVFVPSAFPALNLFRWVCVLWHARVNSIEMIRASALTTHQAVNLFKPKTIVVLSAWKDMILG